MGGGSIALCDAFWRISDLFRFKAGNNVIITFYLYTLPLVTVFCSGNRPDSYIIMLRTMVNRSRSAFECVRSFLHFC